MLAMILLLAGSPADEIDRAAGSLLREELVSALTKKKALDVNLPGFTGTVSPVSPRKTLAVKASAAALAKDTLTLKIAITGEWLLKGKLALGETPAEVSARVKATVNADAAARIVNERGVFRAVPEVKDVELGSLEVVELTPEPFAGAKALLPGLAKGVLKAKKAEVLKTIGNAIAAVELPRPKVGTVAGAGENRVLRQYAQALAVSRLMEHADEKTGVAFEEKLPNAEVAGKVWLHEPARRARVTLARLELSGGVLYVSGEAEVPVRGECRFNAAEVVEGTTDFSATVRVRFGGEAVCKDGKPGGCNVYFLSASLSDFDAGAAPFRIVRRAVERIAGRLVDAGAASYRVKIEKLLGGPDRPRLVEAAYQRVLGRAPDEASVRAWSAYLDRATPRQMLVGLAKSEELARLLREKDEAGVVRSLYRATLKRRASADEVEASVRYLREKEPVLEERRVRVGRLRFERRMVEVGTRPRTAGDLAAAMAESPEYRERFGEGLPR
jgi:hypothetical protein